MKKELNTVYIVGEYLRKHKKGQICHMKRVCKCNNVAARVQSLRNTYGWEIATITKGYIGRKRIDEYKLIKIGSTPQKYL